MNEVLAALAAYKKRHPELRIGQILWIAAKGDPFYLPDAELLKR